MMQVTQKANVDLTVKVGSAKSKGRKKEKLIVNENAWS